MSLLEWSPELSLDMPTMDRTHQEFVAMLGELESADDAGLVAAGRALLAHTQAHFGQEDEWMRQSPCGSAGCHTNQHRVVLHVMSECQRMAESGRLDVLRQLAQELAVWFPQHALSLDAALASHLQELGSAQPSTADAPDPALERAAG